MAGSNVDVFLRLHDGITGRAGRAAKSLTGLFHVTKKGARDFGILNKATATTQTSIAGTGTAAKKTARDLGIMGGATKKASAGNKMLAGGANAATAAVAGIGRAASATASALGRMTAATIAANRAARAMNAHQAAFAAGKKPYGYWETRARDGKMSAPTVAAMHAKDKAAAKALKGSSVASHGGGMPIIGRAATAAGVGGGLGSSLEMGPGTIAGVGGAVAGYSLLSRFADFQQAEIMTRVIGKRIGQTDVQLDALINQSRKLGASTIFEPQDVLAGGLKFMKSGYTATDAATALPSTLSLAAVSGQDVETTTNQVLNIMAQAKIPAEKMADVVSEMYASFINAKAELGELAQAANFGLAKMTDMGLSTEQAFGMLAGMSQGGQNATKGGRGAMMFLSQIQEANDSAKKVKLMKEFGFDLNKYVEKGRFKTGKSFDEMMDRMAEIHAKDASFLTKLLPANADRAASAAMLNARTMEKVRQGAQALKGTSAVADDARANFEGLTGSIKQLSAAWTELGIAFGKEGSGGFAEDVVRSTTAAINEQSQALRTGTAVNEVTDARANFGRVYGGLLRFLRTAGGLIGSDEQNADLDRQIAANDWTVSQRLEAIRQKESTKAYGAFEKAGFNTFVGNGVTGIPNTPKPPPSPVPQFGTMPNGAQVPIPTQKVLQESKTPPQANLLEKLAKEYAALKTAAPNDVIGVQNASKSSPVPQFGTTPNGAQVPIPTQRVSQELETTAQAINAQTPKLQAAVGGMVSAIRSATADIAAAGAAAASAGAVAGQVSSGADAAMVDH